MLTTVEQREEAARLLALDEQGRLQEAVALALRLAEQQERAMSELVELDRAYIEEFSDEGGGEIGLSNEIEAEAAGG